MASCRVQFPGVTYKALYTARTARTTAPFAPHSLHLLYYTGGGCKPSPAYYNTSYRCRWLKEHPFSYSTFWCSGMLRHLVLAYIYSQKKTKTKTKKNLH